MSNNYNIEHFNFIYFLKFLKENNIFAAAITAVLSEQINEISKNFVDCMIMPIFDRDYDNDGKSDIIKFENKVVKWTGITFRLGKFIIIIVKFIIIMYIIFIISKLLKN